MHLQTSLLVIFLTSITFIQSFVVQNPFDDYSSFPSYNNRIQNYNKKKPFQFPLPPSFLGNPFSAPNHHRTTTRHQSPLTRINVRPDFASSVDGVHSLPAVNAPSELCGGPCVSIDTAGDCIPDLVCFANLRQ